MKVERGTPTVEGRYIAYIPSRCRSAHGWSEPIMTTWHGGKWHHMESTLCWIGPLPVLNEEAARGTKTWDEVFSDLRKSEHGAYVADRPTQEYDL